jgi:hypothetical protein
MMPNPLLELRKLGESAWLDDISRSMLEDGSLARLISEDGVAGLTSNPAIFANSIMTDPKYVQPIAQLLPSVSSSMALYEELALKDLHDAAALLRPLYDSTSGGDGYISMEVSPHLAYYTAGSLAEGKRLWQRLQLPNALIKIPGTEAGLPVIRDLIAAGINVNVTLLFSPERYRAVALAYMDGLSARADSGASFASVASVANLRGTAGDAQVAGPCGTRRETATIAVGVDLGQGSDLQPDQVCRGAGGSCHGEHHAAGNAQRVPASWQAGAAARAAYCGRLGCARESRTTRHRHGCRRGAA